MENAPADSVPEKPPRNASESALPRSNAASERSCTGRSRMVREKRPDADRVMLL